MSWWIKCGHLLVAFLEVIWEIRLTLTLKSWFCCLVISASESSIFEEEELACNLPFLPCRVVWVEVWSFIGCIPWIYLENTLDSHLINVDLCCLVMSASEYPISSEEKPWVSLYPQLGVSGPTIWSVRFNKAVLPIEFHHCQRRGVFSRSRITSGKYLV